MGGIGMQSGRTSRGGRGRTRAPVTRDLALRAAAGLADRDGPASRRMRKLAGKLGIEAMSLYHHVKNKDDLLDGMVDLVFSEINLPVSRQDWQTALQGPVE